MGIRQGSDSEIVYSNSYSPPFFYSYHCTSEILKDFDEVFVLRFLINGLLLPLGKVVAKIVQEYLHNTLSKKDSGTTLNTRATSTGRESSLSETVTDSRPSNDNRSSAFLVAANLSFVQRLQPQHWLIDYLNMFIPPVLRIYNDPPTSAMEVETFEKTMPKQIFRAENFLIDIVTDIALVLTFGVMFPPLAIVGCISVLSLSIFQQLFIGRAVSLARSQPYLTEFVEKLNGECVGARAIVTRAMSSFIELLALFWAGFVFDILGDVIGYRKAIALFIVMAFVPLGIRCINWVHWKVNSAPPPSNNVESDAESIRPSTMNGIELTERIQRDIQIDESDDLDKEDIDEEDSPSTIVSPIHPS